MSLLSPDHAWAAGFIDGEGCITINRRKKGYALMVRVEQKDRRPLDELVRLYGGWLGSVTVKSGRSYWVWVVQCRVAAKMLVLIEPHLRLKRDQAILGISYQESRVEERDKLGRFIGDLRRDEEIYKKMKQLKVVA